MIKGDLIFPECLPGDTLPMFSIDAKLRIFARILPAVRYFVKTTPVASLPDQIFSYSFTLSSNIMLALETDRSDQDILSQT